MSHARLVKTPAPERPELEALLRKAAKVVMTPEQIREQRKSWVRGQLGLAHPEWDTADIARRVDELDESIYGTAPVSPIATQERPTAALALIRKHLGEAFSRQWADKVCDVVTEALSSAERRIEELTLKLAEAETNDAVSREFLATADRKNASLTGQVEDMRERAAKVVENLTTGRGDIWLQNAFMNAARAIRSLPVLPTTGDGGGLSKSVDEVALSIAAMVVEWIDGSAAADWRVGLNVIIARRLRRYLAPTGRETSGEET